MSQFISPWFNEDHVRTLERAVAIAKHLELKHGTKQYPVQYFYNEMRALLTSQRAHLCALLGRLPDATDDDLRAIGREQLQREMADGRWAGYTDEQRAAVVTKNAADATHVVKAREGI